MNITPRHLALSVVVLAFAASCGSSEEAESGPTTMAPGMDMSGDDMDMDMNMGDPDATRAEDVADAAIETGTFELLDTRPAGYDATAGSAAIARYDAGTTVTVDLAGLEPETEFIAHLHEGTCDEAGGDHYKFDPDGSDVPPNEIHLRFISDADGVGFMTAENDATAGPEGRSVVVHPLDLLDNKIACAQFSST